MAATFAHMSTISPPRLTRQFQLASDPGLHHPPVLCRRETNLLPLLNAFLFSLYQKYPLLWDLSSGNLARHRVSQKSLFHCLLAPTALASLERWWCFCGASSATKTPPSLSKTARLRATLSRKKTFERPCPSRSRGPRELQSVPYLSPCLVYKSCCDSLCAQKCFNI